MASNDAILNALLLAEEFVAKELEARAGSDFDCIEEARNLLYVIRAALNPETAEG